MALRNICCRNVALTDKNRKRYVNVWGGLQCAFGSNDRETFFLLSVNTYTQSSYAILNRNFQTFHRSFPDLTFPNDIPRSNSGTGIFNSNTTKIKLSILSEISE